MKKPEPTTETKHLIVQGQDQEENELYLRKVEEKDCDLLFQWINDDECRENSFCQKSISYSEHTNWFTNCMHSMHIFIYILMKGITPIGQVRVECKCLLGRISYTIAQSYRGMGYGTICIRLLEEKICEEDLECRWLTAEVKKRNIASQRIFEELGYEYEVVKEVYHYKRRLEEVVENDSILTHTRGGYCY